MSLSTKQTTQPLLSPLLQSGQNSAMGNLTGIVNDPMAGLAPIQSAAQDSINTSYKNMPNIVTSMLAQRGFGSSGAVGQGTYDTEGARLGSLSNLYGQIAQLGSQRQLSADQIINSMIGTGKGQQTTQTQSPLATMSQMLGSLGSLLGAAGGFGGIGSMLGIGGNLTGGALPTNINQGGGIGSAPSTIGMEMDPSGGGYD